MSNDRCLVIVPCFNEEQSIASLLEEMSRVLDSGYETLIIDDGSHDRTKDVAAPLSRCIRLPVNLGIGGAVQTGLKYALRRGYASCIQIDGDGQHPPGEISKLVRAWRDTGANVVIGSRYVGKGGYRSTWTRRAGARVIAALLNALFPELAITDPTSGMRLVDRSAIELFASHYPHDFPEPVSIAIAARCGLKVHEVPVIMKARAYGSSSISGLKNLAYMIRGLGYIVLTRLQRME